MKELFWVGTSNKDVAGFPESIRKLVGYELYRVQKGEEPTDWKPMSEVGAGVREVRAKDSAGAFRVFYVVWDATSVYVLHAFQKKTRATPKSDISIGADRYNCVKRIKR